MKSYAAILGLLAALLAGCLGDGPSGPDLGDAETRILFVGNSLTRTNDLPSLVRSLGEAAGLSISVASILEPNYSLEDHWSDGLEDEIRRLRADFVVMQQGPSSLPASGEHLVAWAGVIAPVVREAGGEPVLLMVWPDYTRADYFDEVRDHYLAAAEAVNGRFVPAGWSWIETWGRDPELDLYGPDGFHPSYLGTLVAAHTVLAVLFDLDASAIPARADGLPAATLDVVRSAVAASVAGWAR